MLAGEIDRREGQLRAIQVELPALRVKLAALDTSMGLLDSRVRPDAAGVVHAWKDKYGPRGMFKGFILQELQVAGPSGIDTVSLALSTAACFEVAFESKKAFTEFRRNVVLGTLRRLETDGVIEALVANRGGHAPSVWRLKPLPSLGELARLSAQSGRRHD